MLKQKFLKDCVVNFSETEKFMKVNFLMAKKKDMDGSLRMMAPIIMASGSMAFNNKTPTRHF